MKECCSLTCGCGCILPMILLVLFIGLIIAAAVCPGYIQFY